MAWTTPKTWAGGELLTASDLNQYVSDNLSALYDASASGRRNLLHNGKFQIAQRATSVASLTTASYATADRWFQSISSLGTWTQSIENDAPTGSGFRKSFKMLCSTADAAPSASDFACIVQKIEGQNVQDVKKGNADAEKLTISFWTKSNKTGTYIVELSDSDNTRHCAKSYTVSASATWEQQTVTFPADTTGAFDNDNAESLVVTFWLGAGTDRTSGTLATAWASTTTANRAVGQVNVAASNSNYWMVTGCQLEIGDSATPFEHKNFGQELAECQRYYQKTYSYGVVPGTSTATGMVTVMPNDSGALTRFFGNARFPVVMRGTPTVTVYSEDGSSGYISKYNDSASKITVSSAIGTSDASPFYYIATGSSGTAIPYVCHYTAVSDVA